MRVCIVIFASCIVLSSCRVSQNGRCDPMNKAVDTALTTANDQISNSWDRIVTAANVSRNVHLSFFGFSTPFKIELDLKNGTLGPMDTLYRVGDSLKCSDEYISELVDGVLTYKNLELSYGKMTATFLFWTVEGKLTYSIRPRIRFYMVEGNVYDDLCDVWSFGLDGYDGGYSFETDSWFGRFVVNLLSKELSRMEDDNPLLEIAVENAEKSIHKWFRWYWCSMY